VINSVKSFFVNRDIYQTHYSLFPDCYIYLER